MSRSTRAAGPFQLGLVLVVFATMIPAGVGARDQPAASGPPDRSASGVDIRLASATALDRRRVSSAASESIARYTEWFGPPPVSGFTIVDRPWHGAVTSPSAVVIDVPWRSAPETMDLESQVAFGLARRWWPGLLEQPDGAALADSLAWYLQGRVVETLYDFSFFVPGHSADGVRFFGGAWPWTFHLLPLGRFTGGLGRQEFLRARTLRRWPEKARRLPPGLDSTRIHGAHAFATLEQMVGWPDLQGALRVLAQQTARGSIARQDAEHAIASAVGQDLSWFFASAFDPAIRFDYAIADLRVDQAASSCTTAPCVRTRVTVERHGTGQFTGAQANASTAYESGDAMELGVAFADGRTAAARWDGRPASRVFEFESTAPPVRAGLDPDRLLLLEENRLNDQRVLAAGTPTVRKWTAYWIVWLQGALLDYGFLL